MNRTRLAATFVVKTRDICTNRVGTKQWRATMMVIRGLTGDNSWIGQGVSNSICDKNSKLFGIFAGN